MDKIDFKIKEMESEILKSIQEVIQIKSVINEPKEGMPFGEGIDQCLRYTLHLAEKLGFETKYANGYYGYVQMGKGNEMMGILGHLDVVPEGDTSLWTYPPYGGVIKDKKVFGRGAVDNKGPTIASLYAMKIAKDLGYPMKKRIRLILGTNEETRWDDMEKYKEIEEIPDCGFAPDSEYPMIFAEKGLLQFQLYCNKGSNIALSGGNAYNSVPDKCRYKKDLNVMKSLDQLGFSYEIENENIVVIGEAVHTSIAFDGINPITRLCMALKDCNIENEAINFLAEMVGEDCYIQKILGIYEDEPSGKLTFNVGKIDLNDREQVMGIDVRFPVTKDKKEVVEKIKKVAKNYGLDYREIDYLAPLYVPENDSFLTLLKNIYEEETGKNGKPISSGGATYARAFENFVAYGPVFQGEEKMAHQKDEYMSIESIMKSIKIYVRVIEEYLK